ncbi:hypothetical protein [Bacteroides sp.]|uniref:hypothetical protein n=1 Tax=Bacteroides sp. TaxID=29523 RepID=UPI0025B92D87|nr:hypothetical protein [Bacteroides sp.]
MGKREESKRIIQEELDSLRLRIIDNHIRAGQKASGNTIESLYVSVDDNHGILFGRKAFGVLETGRGPGKVPKGFYQIIQQWIKDKGIQVENTKSFAYLVARKIAREGTELHRTGGRDDIYSPEIEKAIQNIMNRVFGIFADDVAHINLNSNEDSNI